MKTTEFQHSYDCKQEGRICKFLFGLNHPGYDPQMIELHCSECARSLYIAPRLRLTNGTKKLHTGRSRSRADIHTNLTRA